MRNDPVVPVRDATGLPLPAHGEVVGRVQVFAQEGERVCGFLAFQLGEVDDEEGVIEEGFQVRDGMGADLEL